MHERFNDPIRAACYLGSGLAEDFPNGVVQLSFQSGPRLRLQTCRTREAAHLMEQLCQKFRRATVYYDPEATDGVIGEFRCHCDEDIKRKCCHHGKDRPRVFVRLMDVGAGALYPDAVTVEDLSFSAGQGDSVR